MLRVPNAEAKLRDVVVAQCDLKLIQKSANCSTSLVRELNNLVLFSEKIVRAIFRELAFRYKFKYDLKSLNSIVYGCKSSEYMLLIFSYYYFVVMKREIDAWSNRRRNYCVTASIDQRDEN